ncbi:class I SAM-dependent methyltransferase [Chryseobacterium sp. C-71]|uniref:methyltransferase domain-containing protein n=1 Tax=Chryseobacterium sp. C-71 TaxID=2893882 RepID=UPI001E2D3B72|nr:methyltransferase domain-containing protein [Chryseobacterium sp. C-71]UFH30876.1 class I SAM-dependent methyltransferase [Chryseobacterium sp. C-71]
MEINQKNMFNIFKKKTEVVPSQKTTDEKIAQYLKSGKNAWSEGYVEYKEKSIISALDNITLKTELISLKLSDNFGEGLDERIIEYPWIFANLKQLEGKEILDAGSTFNFDFILKQEILMKNKITIATYAPESPNYNHLGISYVYTDLRETPFKDMFFDTVVSHSTIEHIDMDNSIYGYDITHIEEEKKSYEYLLAIKEYLRILKSGGQLLLTFPFGKFENHGFFQQFDSEMLERIIEILNPYGEIDSTFFQYKNKGWKFTTENDCANVVSFNPHTGKGKGDDGAAHCRSVCCINFIKK